MVTTFMSHPCSIKLHCNWRSCELSIVNRTWACGAVYEVSAVVALQFESLAECSMVWRCVPIWSYKLYIALVGCSSVPGWSRCQQ